MKSFFFFLISFSIKAYSSQTSGFSVVLGTLGAREMSRFRAVWQASLNATKKGTI
jgi:hypothetical protein